MRIGINKFLAIAFSATMLFGCEATRNANNKQKGAVIGAGSGAVIGGVIGNNVGKGNTALGAIIGGVVGGDGYCYDSLLDWHIGFRQFAEGKQFGPCFLAN